MAMMEVPAYEDGIFNVTDLLDDSYLDVDSMLNDSDVNDANLSLDNTYLIYPRTMYPSGYTLPHIIIASIMVTAIMIVVVVGNMLVIIAIATEKSLKNIQNWFIASLAVADFFLGLVIMPFSLANELMGYWTFGSLWCDIHSAMDVLLSTASIMNLCLISLDRYWSITQAIDYLKKRTPSRAIFMIAFVWLASGLICIPPLLGWKVERVEEQYPKCQLSEDIGYVLYSALGSFYIPSCIMVFVYVRIYFAAKARARRGIRKIKKQPKSAVMTTTFTTISETGRGGSQINIPEPVPGPSFEGGATSPMRNIVTIEGISPCVPLPIPIVTCDLASDVSTSDNPEANAAEATDSGFLEPPKDTLKVTGGNLGLAAARFRGSTLSVPGESSGQAALAHGRTPSVGPDTDLVSEFDPSSSDSGVVSRCSVVKPLRMRFCKPIFKGRAARDQREVIDLSQTTPQGPAPPPPQPQEAPKTPKPRDPEREKRRIARQKEKRATLILGLIMGSFIACWLPFFVLYILTPLCGFYCRVHKRTFAFAFWLGYTNSALNPVIYTIFNKDFRKAFRRILFK